MIRLITLLMVLVVNAVTAQTQYETGMKKALTLWGENKPTEASALFERIATVEKNNWLPSYYVALVNTTEAFKTKDKDMINALLTKAQTAQDNAMVIAPDNAELLVMQAMINTAWIVYDPMTNGMKLSAKTNELYDKAISIAPKNPRVVFCKAEFEIGAAAYFNMDTKPMCAEIERAIGLFATFKPESAFHPNWGLDRAQNALKQCDK
ncbi:hypothetical protein [Flavobacterium cerinum]|uniref:Tetratricopeptide repeat protein n=1 Tax=Flavobacterium cerinum TaxID=2502784 RepID=A0A3S3TVA5_9FLAO|nr:hypothetical protein [Flavobacterium cerinum]RWW92032.1 hypothetical protein EPI11_16640 [Flavobacterium cerinum]